jgi:hypothetical protein
MMKGTLRAVLLVCVAGALVSAAIAARSLAAHKSGGPFLWIAIVVPLVCAGVQYVTWGSWNPWKLIKGTHVQVADTEVTRAPWAN